LANSLDLKTPHASNLQISVGGNRPGYASAGSILAGPVLYGTRISSAALSNHYVMRNAGDWPRSRLSGRDAAAIQRCGENSYRSWEIAGFQAVDHPGTRRIGDDGYPDRDTFVG